MKRRPETPEESLQNPEHVVPSSPLPVNDVGVSVENAAWAAFTATAPATFGAGRVWSHG